MAKIKNRNSKCSFFVNPLLAVPSIMEFVVLSAVSLHVAIDGGLFIFCTISWVGLLIGFCMIAPRLYARVVFNANTVVFKAPFHKAKENSYDTYRYIYKATYLHIAYYPQYIVFSQTRLYDYELQNINQIAPTEKIIKIRYSKRTFKALQQALPEKTKMKMEQCFR